MLQQRRVACERRRGFRVRRRRATHIGKCKSHSATAPGTRPYVQLTSEVIGGPGAEEAGPAGVLVEHKLVVLAGSAGPAAAHLSFTDHLETRTHIQRSQSSSSMFL